MSRMLLLSFIFFLTACSQSTITTDQSLTLEQSYEESEKQAQNTTVRMFMWGGDEGINSYMDQWVKPRLMNNYGINLERIPMDTNEILQKLMSEKKANKEEGTIDVIWINGENFKNAKEQDLLFGPFVEKLPNYSQFIDTESLESQFDFGTKIDGMEAPWGKVQFVFLYDSAKIEDPPSNFSELKEWIQKNPGKFTYPDAGDFTGNAFLRHLLYESIGGPEILLEEGYQESKVSNSTEFMWNYLNDIKPNLWRQGKTYPTTLSDLDRLYSQGEVWMTMGYNEARAESQINDGIFPKSTRSFVLDTGSIGNTHFLAIPFNSPNKVGALTTINFLLSPEAQLTKYESTYWGENLSLDPSRLSKADQSKLASINRGNSVLSPETLKKSLLPEVDAKYVEWIKENWLSEVVQTR
ncbi:ABC transporter substrate-binding protein [Bacillus pinisoli]|uniref:ABC transporter substrate-binding protein n=1 Tax=Bacillus pinisoli TaxID=2901866 RepID=UPI001FF59684|nr:ABC transporter substrate-binding protein [Bacillus pinisoli]